MFCQQPSSTCMPHKCRKCFRGRGCLVAAVHMERDHSITLPVFVLVLYVWFLFNGIKYTCWQTTTFALISIELKLCLREVPWVEDTLNIIAPRSHTPSQALLSAEITGFTRISFLDSRWLNLLFGPREELTVISHEVDPYVHQEELVVIFIFCDDHRSSVLRRKKDQKKAWD